MTKSPHKSESSADREIVTTRLLSASPDLVFDAWTDPKKLVEWWGPNGFTTTIYEMDVRPGGAWRSVMHGPDGIDYQNQCVYFEIERPSRLVYSHISAPKFQMIVTFEKQGDKTHLTMRMVFDTASERDHCVEKFGALEGAKQTVARLAAYLGNADS